MRLGFRKRDEPPVNPSQPHPFRQIDDPGVAAMASGGGPQLGYGAYGQIATTDNFIRKARCGVPGCGRDRHDPIHEADPES
ncbi:MAG: hypothetical protein AB1736_08730 [Chloroflexota bacterium]